MLGSGTYDLTMILGAATLLLWGVHMAQTGVMRIYGLQIRKFLPRAFNHKLLGLAIGAGAATILQSSIAVSIFTANLAAAGAIQVADGLLLMLGADIGSAVVAALLTLNLKQFWPLLMLSGYVLHSIYRETHSSLKQIGRILLGLAMILIALTFMGQVSNTLSSSELIKTIVSSLGDELFIALLLFSILTWLAHSSIAILLFWASLVQAGITTDPSLIMAAILGINLGNALPPIIMVWREGAPARRIVLGNALFKFLGVVLCFVLLNLINKLYANLPGEAGFRVIAFHILFNTLLMVLFSGLVGITAKYLNKLFLNAADPTTLIRPKYIPYEEGGRSTELLLLPVSALAREVLRILGTIQNMLETSLEALITGSMEKTHDILMMEDKVNVLFRAVRTYGIELTRKEISQSDQSRVAALLRYTANLENIGDVICKSVVNVPKAMKLEGSIFSQEGKEELNRLLQYLIGNAQIAAEVIMSEQERDARTLIERKRIFKKMCAASSRSHFGRLSQGIENSLQSSTAHLDLIADMRWISTQLSSIGYDVLPEKTEESGEEGAADSPQE